MTDGKAMEALYWYRLGARGRRTQYIRSAWELVGAESTIFVASALALSLEFTSAESTLFVKPGAHLRSAWNSPAQKVLDL